MKLSDAIGGTPLIFLETISRMIGANIFIKYEAGNPFGSSLDRTALRYIQQGIQSGKLTPDGCIVEASSGDLAVSLAYLCAENRITLMLVMPQPEDDRIPRLLSLLRAEVIFTPAEGGMRAAVQTAVNVHRDTWKSFYPNQFENEEGPHTHYQTTGTEIVQQCRQMKSHLDVFISGVGSGATLMGTGKRLREEYPEIQLVAVEPSESAVLSGGKPGAHGYRGIGVGFRPKIFDSRLVSHVVPVDMKNTVRACHRLLNKEALPCGLTTCANLHAALQLLQDVEYRNKNIILMGHDAIERDLGNRFLSYG